jgi:hypothetical protein
MAATPQWFRIIHSAPKEARIITVKLARVYKRALRYGESSLRKNWKFSAWKKDRKRRRRELLLDTAFWQGLLTALWHGLLTVS